jgi:hypothetical protein
MSKTQIFFEQIPVEAVKKICQEKIRRGNKETELKEGTVRHSTAGADLPSGQQSISQP